MTRRIARRYNQLRDRWAVWTNEVGRSNQARFAYQMSNRIFSEAEEKGYLTGRHLYDNLPSEVVHHVMQSNIDPYDRDLSRTQIFNWLWDHVVFDQNGEIVAIHDKGFPLINQREWGENLEWFWRIKKDEWLARERSYHD